MNRSDLRRLAGLRLEDSRVLLEAGQYSGAYYLVGYAIECGLKAAIAKSTRKSDFPNLGLVRAAHTHDLRALVGLAGLDAALQQEEAVDGLFSQNWATVKDWSAAARYDERTAQEATISLSPCPIDAMEFCDGFAATGSRTSCGGQTTP